MLRVIMLLLGLCLSLNALAFPCFLTMIKDSCWTNYSLTVSLTDGSTGKVVTTVVVPPGESWARQPFACRPAESLSLKATFTPTIWASDEGRIYSALQDWKLPEAVTKGDTAWNLTVCYPAEFAEVPLPPEAHGKCQCIRDNIPPVKPQ